MRLLLAVMMALHSNVSAEVLYTPPSWTQDIVLTPEVGTMDLSNLTLAPTEEELQSKPPEPIPVPEAEEGSAAVDWEQYQFIVEPPRYLYNVEVETSDKEDGVVVPVIRFLAPTDDSLWGDPKVRICMEQVDGIWTVFVAPEGEVEVKVEGYKLEAEAP